MKKYKSAAYEHLHEEIKNLVQAGDMSAADLREFEQECFKGSPAAPAAVRAVHAPAMAVSPGSFMIRKW
jgi:DNA-binding transcriptional regulator YiaG